MTRILIAENDEIFIRLISQKIRSKLKFKFDVATTFQETKSLVNDSKNEYLAAILDLNLPDAQDGKIVDFVISKNIPSIVFTSSFDDEIRNNMLSKNIVDYVIKENVQDVDYVIRTIHRIVKNRFIKVMVVDDSDILRKTIKRLLRIHRYRVIEAKNGLEALNQLDKNPDIKLIITDYQMPIMNGFDLVSNVRKKYTMDQLAIIGISAHGSGLLSAKFLKKGANDFVNKPFIYEEFHCRINQNIEMLEHIEAIQEASNKDYLTGLCNRRSLFNLGRTLYHNVRRKKLTLTIAMLDIDFFKKINDTYGHETGDSVLQCISECLSKNLREADIVCRFGGEEFCIICTNMTKEEADITFERIRRLIKSKKIQTKKAEIGVTISIGVTTGIFDSLESAINRADEMLYEAKQSGRDRVIIDQINAL
jgi:diguanylate cyclase (GGDEF)-like protein